jgi:ETFB lysine methyltransferase
MLFDESTLPAIPGGWERRAIDLGARNIELLLPADPDAFLEDSDVLNRHEESEYMPYWAHLWPVAEQMAAFALKHNWQEKTRTLEIGAGVGLVGLAGLANGLHVTFSDYDQVAIDVVLQTATLNSLEHADSMWLDWRDIPDHVQPFDIVLGCEVIYEHGNHPLVLDVLDKLLADDGECWIGDPGRQYSPAFRELAMQRGYQVEVLSISGEPIQVSKKTTDDLPSSQPRLLKLIR